MIEEKRKKADREDLNDLKVVFHNNYEIDKGTFWLLSFF
jgi:hypothetical protein